MVIANPEELMKDGGGFEKLWKKEHFTSQIISMVWDEAHCISTWNSFRADYKKAYRIRYMLPKLRFLLASATFDTEIKNDVFKTMHISPLTCAIFQHSNDRPNVHIEVHCIQHALHTYADLDFIFPPNWKPGDDLPRFLIFFDSIKESISAAEKLQSQLGASTRHKIVWFNSTEMRLAPGVRILHRRLGNTAAEIINTSTAFGCGVSGGRCLQMFSASRYGEVEGIKIGEFELAGMVGVGVGAGWVREVNLGGGGIVAQVWRARYNIARTINTGPPTSPEWMGRSLSLQSVYTVLT